MTSSAKAELETPSRIACSDLLGTGFRSVSGNLRLQLFIGSLGAERMARNDDS